MAQIVRTKTVDPATLSEAESTALIDALYPVHCEIFAGVSREEFAHYVVHSTAERTRIQLSYGEADELAGYIAVHSFRRTFQGEICTVTRAEAGLRRPYRGNGSPGAFLVSNLLQTTWDFSGPNYYLGCLVHPSSYCAFVRDAAQVFPSPDASIPPEVLAFMIQLGDEFKLQRVDAERPLVRQVGWTTKDTEAERRYWQNTELAVPRFYIEQNPGYANGHGLLTLVPFHVGALGKSILKWGSAQVKRRLQRVRGSVERSLWHSPLDAETAAELLAKVEAATGMDLDSVRRLGIVGTRYPVEARSVLFREGDRADAMYAVVSGSVFVLGAGPDQQEYVIDQLGPGTMVGEMGLATGQPRTATVRAAVDSMLLRITHQDLEHLFTAEPRLRDEFWQRISQRIVERCLRISAPGSRLQRDFALSSEDRTAWVSAGLAKALVPGEHLVCPDGGILILALGELLVESPHGWMSLSSPAVASLAKDSTITGISPVQLMLLSPAPPSPLHGRESR